MVDAIGKPVDSGNTFFDIFVKTGQVCMGFEANAPAKGRQHAYCMRLLGKDMLKSS